MRHFPIWFTCRRRYRAALYANCAFWFARRTCEQHKYSSRPNSCFYWTNLTAKRFVRSCSLFWLTNCLAESQSAWVCQNSWSNDCWEAPMSVWAVFLAHCSPDSAAVETTIETDVFEVWLSPSNCSDSIRWPTNSPVDCKQIFSAPFRVPLSLKIITKWFYEFYILVFLLFHRE